MRNPAHAHSTRRIIRRSPDHIPPPAPRKMMPKPQRPVRTRTDVTYTFSTFSTFVDLTAWKIARMPGGYTVDLTSFFGKVCAACCPVTHRASRACGTQAAPASADPSANPMTP